MRTRKIILLLIVSGLIFLHSCDKEVNHNVHIEGTIEGLRKGKLYLQRLQDSILVSIDSVSFENEENFSLKTLVDEPEMMLLKLQKHGSDDYIDYISFFVESSEYNIQTKMISFHDAKINTTSTNQQKWKEYNDILSKFNNQQLDLLAEQILADEERKETLQKQLDLLFKRKYLYSINFALKNNDLAVSPYVVISEIPEANIKYLDSIYNSYSEEIKNSLYGKQFNQLLIDRKSTETNDKNI